MVYKQTIAILFFIKKAVNLKIKKQTIFKNDKKNHLRASEEY